MTADRGNDVPARPSLSEVTLIDQVCDDFEEAWRKGEHPRISDYLGSVTEPLRSRLFDELLLSDLAFRTRDETTIDTGDYSSQFPDRAEQIQTVISRFWSEYSRGRGDLVAAHA